ncbi:MAG TPA: DPP IV N-terminal domain-containing protein [Bacteroidia bacterium]|nr:DPP IV N-terminal domain-containing protein [Bacteroidia bacterium]
MKKQFIFLALVGFSFTLVSQEKLLTIQEAVWKGRTGLAPAKLKGISFVPGTKAYSYIESNALLVFSSESAKQTTKIELSKLNGALKAAAKDTLAEFPLFSWEDATHFTFFDSKGSAWLYSISDSKLSAKEFYYSSEENREESPDKKFIAYTKENNLFIGDGKEITNVSKDGNYNIVYGTSVHRDEFGIHKGTYWSPKSNFLAFYRMDQSDVTDYPIIDWTTYPAQNKNIKYPMAGNKSHYVTLGVYDLAKKSTIYIKTEGPKDQYLTNIAWSPDEKNIYIAVLNREQNHFKLNEYNAADGTFKRTLFEEKDEKYVEPQKAMIFLKKDPSKFIWHSRRDGYMHLYLYDISGKMIKQLTKGNWEIKDFNGFDEKGENIFFHANEQSPVNQDYYKVNLASGKMTKLTEGSGFHTCIADEHGSFAIDNFSSCYTPRENRVINTANGKSNNIFKADNPIKEYKTGKWKLFSIKNAEGTDLYSRIFLPTNFDSTKKYPVLMYLYNGPHSQQVTNTWLAGGELWYQYMAEKGFIVFTLDGRGTSWRGKAFEQAIHRQIGTCEMADQLKGVEYLKSLPYVDAARIGVHGWSYGGFMTTSLMTRNPGVFKVAVAGGPVIDWSYYEIMYGERYMDTPQENKEGYEKNNLLNYVQNLKGKLLMIHGAQDPVVVWQHSILYQKKAVDKGVLVDYYVYPGHEHNVLGKDRAHLMDKICTYFIENL